MKPREKDAVKPFMIDCARSPQNKSQIYKHIRLSLSAHLLYLLLRITREAFMVQHEPVWSHLKSLCGTSSMGQRLKGILLFCRN